MRGLAALGVLPRLGYLSAVSGGAWAATAQAFYAGAGTTDDAILGPVVEPPALTPATLATLAPTALGHAATLPFRETLGALHAAPDVARERVWTRAVGETFLAPFGLFDPGSPRGFTLDAASAREIHDRNPDLAPLHVVRCGASHPLLLVHATLNWPVGDGETTHKVGFEHTPRASGSPPLTTLEAGDRRIQVGGGMVESFAFGCRAPTVIPPDGLATVEQAAPFTLADMVGATSAFSTPDRDRRSYPHVDCWPVTTPPGPTTQHVFTDGGDLENFGIIPLLRRGVRSIAVFINTVWPISMDLDPDAGWPVDPAPDARVIDPFLAPLFGQPSTRFPHNQVFPARDFPALLRGLLEAKRAGRTVMATTTHAVQDNAWWGVTGGWEARVAWVYNDRVPSWEAALPAETRAAIGRGTDGPVARFPHYATREQNPGWLIRLTAEQVNLLGHLGCWTVTANGDTWRELFE